MTNISGKNDFEIDFYKFIDEMIPYKEYELPTHPLAKRDSKLFSYHLKIQMGNAIGHDKGYQIELSEDKKRLRKIFFKNKPKIKTENIIDTLKNKN